MISDGYISFKAMCAQFEVTPRTLRYYEYIELLSPKKVGRTRHYGPREIARMKLILRGRRFGFSLEDIRQWLMLYGQKGTTEQYRKWVQMADQQHEVLAAQLAELQSVIEELRQLRDETAAILDELDAKPSLTAPQNTPPNGSKDLNPQDSPVTAPHQGG